MTIEVRGVEKVFNGFRAIDGVSLTIREGELVALLGPSGSCKTTLLRVIAGLEFATAGHVLFDGEDAVARHVSERKVGFVFQHYALFKHMTVFNNVAFGLRVKPRATRPSSEEITSKVNALLNLVQVEQFGNRYPSQLSGGQRQRVALARALAIEPRVLLLDEPFGALDAKVRKELRRWLRGLHDRMGLTSVFVTHDQEEAMELSDRVAVMNRGRIEQVGSPTEVYDAPATPFVYEFLGNANRLPCRIEKGRAYLGPTVFTEAGGLADGLGIAFVRPHDIEVTVEHQSLSIPAMVRQVLVAGAVAKLELSLDTEPGMLEVELPRGAHWGAPFTDGQKVHWRARTARVFPANAGAALSAPSEVESASLK